MEGETQVAVETRLLRLLVGGDLAALRTYVDSLDDEDRRIARTWAVKARHWKQDDVHRSFTEALALSNDERRRRTDAAHAGHFLLLGLLESPVAAVNAALAMFWTIYPTDAAVVGSAFADRGAVWGRGFAEAADRSSPSADGASSVFQIHLHVVTAQGLSTPTGRLFHSSWIGQHRYVRGNTTLADSVRDHPLMPGVMYALLSSGMSGRNLGLPEAIATLVEEGRLDRDRTLSTALEALTSEQRPTSQQVLAGVLTHLELRTDEIPGGLAYVLGVLASSHGSVVKALLPHAIDLAVSEDELLDLSRTMAARSEKGVRQTFLKALAPAALGARLQTTALIEAIDILEAGEEDVAMRAAFVKARQALGVTQPPAEDDAPAALGLWDLEVVVAPGRSPWRHAHRDLRDLCWRAMRSGDDKPWYDLIERLLDALGRGDFTDLELLATARELGAGGELSAARTSALLEPLFLGGALRKLWPVALQIADLCAVSAGRTGLDKLVRMLASYAVEVPRPGQLPVNLVALAQGTSKAAAETRVLAGRLGASLEPAGNEPFRLGLWRDGTEQRPWDLMYPPVRDLSTIAPRVITPDFYRPVRAEVKASVTSSLRLEEVLALSSEHGDSVVRKVLSAEPLRQQDPTAQALGLWSLGLLTPQNYWRIVSSGVTSSELLQERRDAIEAPPIMPTWRRLDGRERVQFLHSCEALLVHERGGHLISTPDVIDGSLGLDHLLERLASAPSVGPLDLRLAMGRLRPTTPSDADRVTSGPGTLSAVTSPSGAESMSSSDIVREWLLRGGLQVTRMPVERLDRWEFAGEAPLSWGSLAALEGAEISDAPSDTRRDDAWWLPARPDVWLRQSFWCHSGGSSVADVGGELGVHSWEAILIAIENQRRHLMARHFTAHDFAALIRLQNQERLAPGPAVAAATALWDGIAPDFLGEAVGWERAMLRGCMRGLYPVAYEIVLAGRARPERPAGLSALTAVLRKYFHELPPDLREDA